MLWKATMTPTLRTPVRPQTETPAWINLPAAQHRLGEIDRLLDGMEVERAMIQKVLASFEGPTDASPAGTARPVVSGPPVPVRRPSVAPAPPTPVRRRQVRVGGLSLLEAVTEVMAQAPMTKEWGVGELRNALLKVHPEKVSAPNASGLISSALIQSLRAGQTRFSGTEARRGTARKYRLGPSAVIPGTR